MLFHLLKFVDVRLMVNKVDTHKYQMVSDVRRRLIIFILYHG